MLVNIAVTAINTFLTSIFAPGPTTPAPPTMLFVVLGWVQRELRRTFFNQTPTAVIDDVTTAEDTGLTIAVLANDTDADLADGDVLTVTDYTQPANGTVVLNPTGTFTYTPAANYTGTDTFTYTISDEASPWHLHRMTGLFTQGGHTSTTTVTVTVTAVDDAPIAVDDIAAAVAEDGGPTLIDVLANDTDIDGGPESHCGHPTRQRHSHIHRHGRELHAGRELQRHRRIHLHPQRRRHRHGGRERHRGRRRTDRRQRHRRRDRRHAAHFHRRRTGRQRH